jgi:hypothetical protein
MRRHLATWVNDLLFERLGGPLEAGIVSVTEQMVRNRFTAQRELQPVIALDSGHRWIPNITARRALIEMFGAETDNWIGRRIAISRRRVERVNRETGESRETWVKVVTCADVHARVLPMTRPGRSEYDEALAEPGEDAPLTADQIFGGGRRG